MCRKELGFRNWGSLRMCSWCTANRAEGVGAIPWTESGSEALWVSSVGRPSPHPVFDISGLSILNAMPDLMHTGCLGVVQYLIGGCMWDLLTSRHYYTGARS